MDTVATVPHPAEKVSNPVAPVPANRSQGSPTAIPLLPLAKGFRHRDQFETTGYRLMPFRFMDWDEERYIATNLAGEYLLLPKDVLRQMVRHQLSASSEWYLDLKAKHFLYDDTSSVALELLAAKYRTQQSQLKHFTALHIFVVTLRCDHSCPYCQVSRVSQDRVAFDMTRETADRSLDLVFRSPSPVVKIEFQGGESLLNFELIRYVVEEAEKRKGEKIVEFVIATNLSPLADSPEKAHHANDILGFCRQHKILISTSLDGPSELHNGNRPRPGGDSHQRAVRGIEKVRAALGHSGVSALMTTTASSLGKAHAIIDEYRKQGFGSIFLRPISPFGFAVKSAAKIGYEADAFLEFYRQGLNYIVGIVSFKWTVG